MTRRNEQIRRLSILGTRGIPARYGGFETFAEQLSLHLVAKGWEVTVYCQVETEAEAGESNWQGVRLLRLAAPGRNALGTMWFDWKAVVHAAREQALVLTLGYNTAAFLFWLKLRRVPNLINMDGLEWRRAKWGTFAKAWLFLNERLAPWFADHLIADHPHIRRHLEQHVPAARITMIPYGSVTPDSVEPEWERQYLQGVGLSRHGFALVVARPEPENSILEMLQAFVQRPRGLQLVVVGRYIEDLPYHAKVLSLARKHPESVLMLGPVYEQLELQTLRRNARVYLHGHRVGGTNPSLVEALGAGNACVLQDNEFNRWVAGDAGRYFHSVSDCGTLLDQLLDDAGQLAAQRHAAVQRHEERFVLRRILDEYEQLLANWSHPASG
jgi:glycosyltransferase involved in cell wall biosynthesis